MVCQRLSICQDWAAPLEMVSITFSMSRPARLREMQRLGQAFDQPADADLVDHLGELAGARRADQIDRSGIGFDHRLGLCEIRLVAADHDGERAVLGARLAARHRRIERAGAALLGGFVKLAGDIGGGGGVIDEDGAAAERGEGAMLPERHRAEIVVIADAGEDEFGAVRRLGGGGREPAAESRDPGFGLGARAVEDRDVVAAGVLRWPAMGKPMTPSPIQATLLMLNLTASSFRRKPESRLPDRCSIPPSTPYGQR